MTKPRARHACTRCGHSSAPARWRTTFTHGCSPLRIRATAPAPGLRGTQRAAAAPAIKLIELVIEDRRGDPEVARQCLATLAAKIQNRELSGPLFTALRERLRPILQQILARKPDGPIHSEAVVLG